MKDCNKCKYLNMTETEQVDKTKNHICLQYCAVVVHMAQHVNHSPYLYPCFECKMDGFKFYEEV